ncbi:MAG: hypothetical protein IKV16_01060, partial [Clostridia bacterium]|nr:hypothetical protein [Clostridia bacterium]
KEEKNLSGSSAKNEALSKTGLSKSGYAGYLGELIKKDSGESVKKAIDDYLSTDSKNKSAFDTEILRREEERAAAQKKEAEKKAKEEAKAESERLKAEAKAEAERLKAEAKAEAERIKAEQEAKKQAEKEAEDLAKDAEKEAQANDKRYEELMKKVYKETEAALKSNKTTSFDIAYDYAIKQGLDEKSAADLAKSTTEQAINDATNKVISAIVSRFMTSKQAKEYALTLGLSQKDADILGEFAYKLNESASDIVSDENYLNNLREQIKQNYTKG